MLMIREMKLAENKYNKKATYPMQPVGIVIHNTWNYAPAINEVSYMQTNDLWKSFHFAVDEKEAIQGLPLDRNSWNAGDGTYGTGNRKYISIEICRSRSNLNLFKKAEKNGAVLTALLLKKYGWDISKVKKHQDFSGKYCPHRTLDLGWKRFLNMVQSELDKLNRPPVIAKTSSHSLEKIIGLYEIIEGPVNTRKGPGTSYQIIKSLSGGTRIPITKILGNWGQVACKDEWIYLGLCNKINKFDVSVPHKTNIRREASSSSEVIDRFLTVKETTIQEVRNGWGLIKSKTGWIWLGLCELK